jgi:hypothetical protein
MLVMSSSITRDILQDRLAHEGTSQQQQQQAFQGNGLPGQHMPATAATAAERWQQGIFSIASGDAFGSCIADVG